MPSLKFNPNQNIIVLETKIWGTSLATTAQLVFDTGASLVILPWKIVTALGIKIDPTKTIQTTTASSVETATIITIPKISVLGQEVKNVKAIVKDLPEGSGVDGLLGLSYIKNFNVEINFKTGELTLNSHK
ncbi:MAG: retropepsin-like aspartic protease [Patescibacteria group bacterium]